MSASARSVSATACDVLVLGAGLAGMRAAWAAKRAAPRARVLLVSPRRAPAGSSFANRNNALGVQAPATPAEAADFAAEALRLAPPGDIDEALVRALAADAPARLAELAGVGVRFRAGPGATGGPEGSDRPGGPKWADGTDLPPLRFPGCFSAAPRAVVIEDLARLHAALAAHVSGLGVETLCGFEALDLPRDGAGRVLGARLAALRGAARLDVRARAVVAAMGGPAPLFARRMCGPGGSGLGLGLLASAGAALVNARYLQFFWLRQGDRAFVNPGTLDWPPELATLAAARRTHCPVSFGLPDAALDARLLALRGPDGVARPAGGPALALYAHAGNGGARIDERGRTATPGLLACGECAGGMHGANRLGGAMTLACLVFGARAGIAAAQQAGGLATPPALPFDDRPPLSGAMRDEKSAAFLRRLRLGMDKHAAPGGSAGGPPHRENPEPARTVFTARLRGFAGDEPGGSAAAARRRLLARSALAVLEG